jgi:hypothetical protein
MPFLAQEQIPIPSKDLLSWMFDEQKYDADKPVSTIVYETVGLAYTLRHIRNPCALRFYTDEFARSTSMPHSLRAPSLRARQGQLRGN